MAETKAWDTVITNGLMFDGSGKPPERVDLAIKNGRVAACGQGLPRGEATRVIDADGQWLMPGMMDIHTHLDLEVDLAPGLPEVVRHGTTSVVVGNCSLGTCFGTQKEGDQNPIVVPAGGVAIGNTPALPRRLLDGRSRQQRLA